MATAGRGPTLRLQLSGSQHEISKGLSPPFQSRSTSDEQPNDKLLRLHRLDNGQSSSVWKGLNIETLQLIALKDVTVKDAKSREMVRQEIAALESQRVSPIRGTNGNRCGSNSDDRLDGFSDEPLEPPPTAGTIASPFIVAFYGCTARQGVLAAGAGASQRPRSASTVVTIALEFCSGGSLQQWVDARRPWSAPWVRLLASQALTALEHLRQRRRLHRDVKPANLLLVGRGGGVKLADFGVSAPADEDGMRDTMVGTKIYMSPERLRAEQYGYAADVYSLGLSLAAVVLGECPFPKAESEFEQLGLAETAATTVRRRAAATAAPLPPRALVEFLEDMLCPDPAARPTAAELLRHPFLVGAAAAPFPSTDACAAVVAAFDENRRRSRDGFDAPRFLQQLAQARLDHYLVVPDESVDPGPLAEDLGMSGPELLRALDAATREELALRLGADLAERVFSGGENRECRCGSGGSGRGGGSRLNGTGRHRRGSGSDSGGKRSGGGCSSGASGDDLACCCGARNVLAASCFSDSAGGMGCRGGGGGGGGAGFAVGASGASLAALGDRLRGIMFDMSTGAPEDGPPTCGSAHSTALSCWGSDADGEAGGNFGGGAGGATPLSISGGGGRLSAVNLLSYGFHSSGGSLARSGYAASLPPPPLTHSPVRVTANSRAARHAFPYAPLLALPRAGGGGGECGSAGDCFLSGGGSGGGKNSMIRPRTASSGRGCVGSGGGGGSCWALRGDHACQGEEPGLWLDILQSELELELEREEAQQAAAGLAGAEPPASAAVRSGLPKYPASQIALPASLGAGASARSGRDTHSGRDGRSYRDRSGSMGQRRSYTS